MNRYQLPSPLLLILFCLFLSALTLFIYGPGGDDDTHISYTVALHLAETGSIVNHSGQAVEQGSSLLHILTLAGSYKLISNVWPIIKLTDVGPLFSLIAAMLCFPLLLNLAKRCNVNSRSYLLSILTLSVSFSYWAIGGLESSLTSLCLLGLALAVSDCYYDKCIKSFSTYTPVFICCALVIMVRPEGYFIIAAFLLALQVLIVLKDESGSIDKYFCLKIFIVSTGLFLSLCLWRENYFSQWFPQPVYAKAEGISLDKIIYGFLYFLYSMQLSIIIYTGVLLSLLSMIFFRAKQFEFSLLVVISLCCSYLAFIIVSGGDWMTGGRFFTPIIPLLVLLNLKALESFAVRRLFWGLLLLLTAVETTFFALNFSTGENILLAEDEGFVGSKTAFNRSDIPDERYSWSEKHNMMHLRDMGTANSLIDIIEAIKSHPPFQHKTIDISSIQMGMIPYHISHSFGQSVKLIDLRGLSTHDITSCSYFDGSTRNWLGIKASYDKYFAAIESGECPNLTLPDIIYDLSNLAPEDKLARFTSIEARGYHIVYQQLGFLQNRQGNKAFDAAMFIAVSEQVYQALPLNLRNTERLF